MANEEVKSLTKIIGLQHGKQYTSLQGLRYGKLMIMTDQDHDGSHIKGFYFFLFYLLQINLILHF